MDCARVEEELIGFELAALDGATRAAVEAHLAGCARCVSSYLALKRAIDAGEDAKAPSEMVRARVRAAAMKQLGVTAPKKRERAPWLAVALASAAAVLAPILYQALGGGRAHHGGTSAGIETPMPDVLPVKHDETIDTARSTPENLAFL
ncbi:MAG TPA: zf-HC2 domain-containing protein [Polyangia bacterium]|nr:zf-HC2 domain-containing protein [Polyangia bacterium]